jgi:hypothetical protein
MFGVGNYDDTNDENSFVCFVIVQTLKIYTTPILKDAAGDYFVIWVRHACLKINMSQRIFQENSN